MTTGLPRSALLATYWRDSHYLAAIPLDTTTVLDYFSYSSFFLPSSNNEILRMQSLADPAASSRREASAIERDLRRFVGWEYVLAHARPPGLFVIHKRWRSSPTQTQVSEAYYVISGNVYMAPDLYTLLGNRLLSSISHLRSSMALVRAARPPMDRREGARWKITPDMEEDDESDDGAEGSEGEEDEQEAPAGESEAAVTSVGKASGHSASLESGKAGTGLRSGKAKTKRRKRGDEAGDGDDAGPGGAKATAQADAEAVKKPRKGA